MLPEPALVAPPESTTWTVNGMKLEVRGREIILAIVRDFDGDGQKDALAIVRVPATARTPGAPTGEIVFFRGGDVATGGVIASGPELGIQPSCVPTARLEMIGRRAAFAEIGSSCPRGDGSRAIFVVRLGTPIPSVSFDAVVVDPREAPKLSVDVDAADRDGDGVDDVVLRIAIEGGVGSEPAPKLQAKLAFFDRPAGPSRDTEEPDASLKTIAAEAASRAGRAKDAASVPALVEQMRALYRAMCQEGGAARVTKIHGGSAVACGTSKSLEDAGVAEVRAFVTLGDALGALASAEVAALPPAKKTSAKTAEVQKLLGEVLPVIEAKGVRTLAAIADPPSPRQPEWGPLAFESTGGLLVRHASSVVRVDPDNVTEAPADVAPWEKDVVSPGGKSRWIEAYHACDGVGIHATFAPTGDGDMSDVLLPIAPRLGKTCGGGRGEPVSTVPLSWGPRGLEAIVAGRLVLVHFDPPKATALATFVDQTPPPGSPRSRGGKTLALALPNGVLVRGRVGPEKWSMLRSPDLEPYPDLRSCTIDDAGSHVACVRRRNVVLVALP